jgi:hypothetical protein
MELVEMKARAYDLIARIEFMQKELKELNNEILKQLQKNELKDGSNPIHPGKD